MSFIYLHRFPWKDFFSVPMIWYSFLSWSSIVGVRFFHIFLLPPEFYNLFSYISSISSCPNLRLIFRDSFGFLRLLLLANLIISLSPMWVVRHCIYSQWYYLIFYRCSSYFEVTLRMYPYGHMCLITKVFEHTGTLSYRASFLLSGLYSIFISTFLHMQCFRPVSYILLIDSVGYMHYYNLSVTFPPQFHLVFLKKTVISSNV